MSNTQERLFFHDLLNVLTVINGQCELLQLDPAKKADLRLAVIRESASRMIEMIENQRASVETEKPKPVRGTAESEGMVRVTA
jgi:hypothetical protein